MLFVEYQIALNSDLFYYFDTVITAQHWRIKWTLCIYLVLWTTGLLPVNDRETAAAK
jgi:hypothetical protein